MAAELGQHIYRTLNLITDLNSVQFTGLKRTADLNYATLVSDHHKIAGHVMIANCL